MADKTMVRLVGAMLTRDPVIVTLGELAGYGWEVWPEQGAVRGVGPKGGYRRFLDVPTLVREGWLVIPSTRNPLSPFDTHTKWVASWEEVVLLGTSWGIDIWGYDTRAILRDLTPQVLGGLL